MACSAERALAALAAAWTVFAAPAAAQDDHTFESRVADAIAQRWDVPVAQLRLEWVGNTPAFDGAFNLNAGASGLWIVVANDAQRHVWKLRAGVTMRCPVAARDLPRATVLDTTDITDTTVVHHGQPAGACADVQGWVTRRAMRRGEPLAAPAVAPPTAVRAGDNVRVTFVRGTVELLLDGRAAGTGPVGGRILVNTPTGKRVMGMITGPGTVEVREAM